jgi:Histidine phosphatase superfamily (branch 2)
MEGRRIPPLTSLSSSSSSSRAIRLVHVTVVSRHGARAPKGKHECWPGYYSDFDTAVWDCHDLTTVGGRTGNVPPSLFGGGSTFTENSNSTNLLVLERVYDGLPSSRGSGSAADTAPQTTITNILNGTCQVAQLLRKGYDQHLWNGRMLRSTYVNDVQEENGTASAAPGATVQFLPANLDPTRHIHFRSDDEQRTIASGQALLLGLLGADRGSASAGASAIRIPVHTADKARDVISANDDLCEKLKDLEDKAYDSKDYKHLQKDYDLKETKEWMKAHFGYKLSHPMQCLMTAICNDRTLPDVLDDYAGDEKKATTERGGNFHKLVQYELVQKNFVYSYDHAAYAKLAMGPLWNEILLNVQLAIATDHQSTKSDGPTSSPKLAYYSGHDSTISQLLSSLGSKVWELTDEVPYASLMVLEVHHVPDGAGQGDDEGKEDNDDDGIDEDNDGSQASWSEGFKFRLLFNGRVLTQTIKHCHDELCELRILADRVEEFATHERDCQRKRKKAEEDTPQNSDNGEDDAAPTDATNERTEENEMKPIPATQSPWTELFVSAWGKAMASVLFGVCAGSISTWIYLLHYSPLRLSYPTDS